MNDSYVAGVDIGGTHITVALVDLKEKSILAGSYIRKSVDSSGNSEEILTAWCDTINTVLKRYAFIEKKIGIAMPGPFDYENGISYIRGQQKYDGLYQLNVKEHMAERLHVATADIRFVNDASCFLSGEVFNGSARGCHSAIGLTLGTGLGTAHFSNGVTRDANLWCTPFNESIAEDYISTRWFIKRCYELTGINVNNVKDLTESLSVNGYMQQLFDEFGTNLATFLKMIVTTNKPEVIVIGGSIAKAYDKFFPSLKQHFDHTGIEVVLLQAELGDMAPLFGAANSWSMIDCD